MEQLHYFPLILQLTIVYIKTQNEELKNIDKKFNIYNYLSKCKKKAEEV